MTTSCSLKTEVGGNYSRPFYVALDITHTILTKMLIFNFLWFQIFLVKKRRIKKLIYPDIKSLT